MLQVREISRKLGINPQTLYFYERIGLIPPTQRTESGYRLFSQQDVKRLTFIIHAKSLGLSLDEIKEILTLKDGKSLTCKAMHEKLLRKLEEIDNNISQLQKLREELLPLVEHCHQKLSHSDSDDECFVLEDIQTMLKVEILGTGCKKCHQLEANAKAAIVARNLEADISHITDTMEIVKRGVMKTPALVVNGKVISQGKVLEVQEIEQLLPV